MRSIAIDVAPRVVCVSVSVCVSGTRVSCAAVVCAAHVFSGMASPLVDPDKRLDVDAFHVPRTACRGSRAASWPPTQTQSCSKHATVRRV